MATLSATNGRAYAEDLNVTVTDSVTFTLASSDTNIATVSPITVTNNSTLLPADVTNISATAATGYTLMPFNNNFSSYAADSGRFGLALTENSNTHDLSGAGYNLSDSISAGNSKTYTFAGKSSVFSVAKNDVHIANIVLTITPGQIPSLQNFSCSELPNIGDTTSLIDERDNNSYNVARITDSICIMTENLRLGSNEESLTVTTANGGSFLLDTRNGNFGNGSRDKSLYICVEEYGCFYNWYTATAGSGGSSVTTGDAADSICPTGWKLPSKDEYSAIAALGHSTLFNNYNFVYGGYYYGKTQTSINQYGRYWSRTSNNANTAYRLQMSNYPAVTNEALDKYYGNFVRCEKTVE
jgi:hypothetical protein